MQVLEFTLTVLTFVGGWRPISWTSLRKYIMYNAYMTVLSAVVFTFTMSQFIQLVVNASNADELTETLYVVLIGIIGSFKIATVNINHQSFLTMIGNLNEKPFKPMQLNETIIQMKFDKIIKTNTFRYLMLIVITASYIVLISLCTDFKRRDLTFKAWFPFDYSISAMYYFVYVHQMISILLSSLLNVACDSLFSGLLLQICCQFEILEYRLSIANSHDKIRECVIHHYHIFEFARLLNEKLAVIIGSQIIGSSLVVCCLLFRLLMSSSSAMYIQTIMCMCCSLWAIFYYCWFGNEVRLKSLELSENIYKMEWLELNNNMKKCLLIIMTHTTSSPIIFTSARIVPLNLESFVVILKTSYSIFNLMHQTE